MARTDLPSTSYPFRIINSDVGWDRPPKLFKEDRHLKDQFGRNWVVTFELSRYGGPTGLYQRGFPEVLHIPQKYVVWEKTKPVELHIDFERWIVDVKQDWLEWQNACEEQALHLYGEKAQAAEPTARVLDRVGPAPEPVALIALYQAGDKYLLGEQVEPTRAVLKAAPAWVKKAQARAIRQEQVRIAATEARPTHHLDPEMLELLEEQYEDQPKVSQVPKGPKKPALPKAEE